MQQRHIISPASCVHSPLKSNSDLIMHWKYSYNIFTDRLCTIWIFHHLMSVRSWGCCAGWKEMWASVLHMMHWMLAAGQTPVESGQFHTLTVTSYLALEQTGWHACAVSRASFKWPVAHPKVRGNFSPYWLRATAVIVGLYGSALSQSVTQSQTAWVCPGLLGNGIRIQLKCRS